MGQVEGMLDVLLDQEDRDPPDVNRLNGIKNATNQRGGEPQRGFIEHQEFWIGHERPSDRTHLLFSSGEGPGKLISSLCEIGEEGESVLQVQGLFRSSGLVVGSQFQVFQDGHKWKEAASFWDLDDPQLDPPGCRDPTNGLSFKVYFTLPGSEESRDHPKRGSLPGGISPNEDDDFPLLNFQRDAVKHLDVPVKRIDLIQLKQGSTPLPDRRQ